MLVVYTTESTIERERQRLSDYHLDRYITSIYLDVVRDAGGGQMCKIARESQHLIFIYFFLYALSSNSCSLSCLLFSWALFNLIDSTGLGPDGMAYAAAMGPAVVVHSLYTAQHSTCTFETMLCKRLAARPYHASIDVLFLFSENKSNKQGKNDFSTNFIGFVKCAKFIALLQSAQVSKF